MKIKIEEKQENPLLTRQDITFLVDHAGTATPSRIDIRAKLAAMLNCKEDQLYIVKLTGLYGQPTSQGLAHLYPSTEVAVTHEQAHIIKRHSIEEAAPAPSMESAKTTPEEKKEEPKEPPKEKVDKPPKEELPEKKDVEKPPKKEQKEPPKKEKVKEETKKKEESKAAPTKKGTPKKEEKPQKGKPKKEKAEKGS